jgi:hypothetical protein
MIKFSITLFFLLNLLQAQSQSSDCVSFYNPDWWGRGDKPDPVVFDRVYKKVTNGEYIRINSEYGYTYLDSMSLLKMPTSEYSLFFEFFVINDTLYQPYRRDIYPIFSDLIFHEKKVKFLIQDRMVHFIGPCIQFFVLQPIIKTIDSTQTSYVYDMEIYQIHPSSITREELVNAWYDGSITQCATSNKVIKYRFVIIPKKWFFYFCDTCEGNVSIKEYYRYGTCP